MIPPRGDSNQLTSKASELLVQLWQQIEASDRQLTRVSLRKIAQQVTFDARKTGWRPEELVLAVKGSWKLHDGIGRARDPRRSQATVAEFISLCITEFYGWSESELATDSADGDRAPGAKPAKRSWRQP